METIFPPLLVPAVENGAEVTITDIAATLIHIDIVATGSKTFGIGAGDGHVNNIGLR